MQADAPRRAIKVDKPSVWESVRLFLNARETRMVCGIVLVCGVLLCVVSTFFVVNKLVAASKDDLYY